MILRWAGIAVGLAFIAFVGFLIVRSWWAAEQWYVVSREVPPLPPAPVGLREARFETEDGLELHGWFLPPSGGGATIVLAHGLGAGRAALLPEATVLAEAGYGVLLFDFRGHGASGGRRTLGFREQLDLQAAILYAREQPGVDPERVGALGFSMGAVTLAEVAADDPELRAVVLLSPFPSLAKRLALDFGGRGPLGTFGAFLAAWRNGVELGAVRAEASLPRIAPRPVLVVVGADERGQGLLDEVEASLPPGSTFWRVPGGGHGGFFDILPERYSARLLAYFDERLGR